MMLYDEIMLSVIGLLFNISISMICARSNGVRGFGHHSATPDVVLVVNGQWFRGVNNKITQISIVLGATANIGEIVTNYVVCITSNMYYFGCTTITSPQMY